MIEIDSHILDPTHAPTPFTSSEIRDGCPLGRTVQLLVERPGETSYLRVNRFVVVDLDGAEQESENLTMDGVSLGAAQAHRSTWLDLQRHASFPLDRTTIEEETIETPIGRLECMRYVVTDGPDRDVFWFARSRPGMPVKFISQQGDVTASTVTMTRDEIVTSRERA